MPASKKPVRVAGRSWDYEIEPSHRGKLSLGRRFAAGAGKGAAPGAGLGSGGNDAFSCSKRALAVESGANFIPCSASEVRGFDQIGIDAQQRGLVNQLQPSGKQSHSVHENRSVVFIRFGRAVQPRFGHQFVVPGNMGGWRRPMRSGSITPATCAAVNLPSGAPGLATASAVTEAGHFEVGFGSDGLAGDGGLKEFSRPVILVGGVFV